MDMVNEAKKVCRDSIMGLDVVDALGDLYNLMSANQGMLQFGPDMSGKKCFQVRIGASVNAVQRTIYDPGNFESFLVTLVDTNKKIRGIMETLA